MRKLLITGAAAALAVVFVPAAAQPAPPPPPGVASGVAPLAPLALPSTPPRVRTTVMSDRVMTRAEASQHVSKMFARLDSNRDGFITRDEVEAIHQKMTGAMGMMGEMHKRLGEHGMMMGDGGAMFDRLDANHDGSISRQEFLASHSQMREQRMIVLRNGPTGAPGVPGEPGMKMRMHRGMGLRGFGGHLFEMADANKDGRVSLAEAQAAALAHFDKADLNHDGRITPDERQHRHEIRIQRRQS